MEKRIATVIEWYMQPEKELYEMCEDVNFRNQLERRLEELRAVNYHGVRCHMSKKQEEKLERVLGEA